MKTQKFEIEGVQELAHDFKTETSGGDFAYDAGFFVRELAIYLWHSGFNARPDLGTTAVAFDFTTRYRPLL